MFKKLLLALVLVFTSSLAFSQPRDSQALLAHGERQSLEFLRTLRDAENSGVRLFSNKQSEKIVGEALKLHEASLKPNLTSMEIGQLERRRESLKNLVNLVLRGDQSAVFQNALRPSMSNITGVEGPDKRLISGRQLSESQRVLLLKFFEGNSHYPVAMKTGQVESRSGFITFMSSDKPTLLQRFGLDPKTKLPRNKYGAVGAAVLIVLEKASTALRSSRAISQAVPSSPTGVSGVVKAFGGRH